jgi:hypothetical protein
VLFVIARILLAAATAWAGLSSPAVPLAQLTGSADQATVVVYAGGSPDGQTPSPVPADPTQQRCKSGPLKLNPALFGDECALQAAGFSLDSRTYVLDPAELGGGYVTSTWTSGISPDVTVDAGHIRRFTAGPNGEVAYVCTVPDDLRLPLKQMIEAGNAAIDEARATWPDVPVTSPAPQFGTILGKLPSGLLVSMQCTHYRPSPNAAPSVLLTT